MPWQIVKPVLRFDVRKLCVKPYPNHPRGCPNWNKRGNCPPRAPLLGDILDLTRTVWAVYNVFDFGAHTSRMRKAHLDWTDRQVECCLYWQGTARKQLDYEIGLWRCAENKYDNSFTILKCPEACGVDVTATMASIGYSLEWPPKTVTYQVALIGFDLTYRHSAGTL